VSEKAEVDGWVRASSEGGNDPGLVDPCGHEHGPGMSGEGGGLGRVQPCPLAKLDSSFSTGQG
jgi:hypothetical protein